MQRPDSHGNMPPPDLKIPLPLEPWAGDMLISTREWGVPTGVPCDGQSRDHCDEATRRLPRSRPSEIPRLAGVGVRLRVFGVEGFGVIPEPIAIRIQGIWCRE